jgi:gamma-glutamyltranspeptidase/glutathione hydrolase
VSSPVFTTRPTLQGSFGMVSSTHWIASTAAMGVLERGGNAFDAAVCAGFVLHVVEPHLNGPAGDLPAIVSAAGGRGAQVLCGQGPAPAGATSEHFTAHGMQLVPGSGPLATAVPGAFDAWMLLLRDRGTMRPAEVLAPAVHYARHGVPVLPAISRTISSVRELFTHHWPTSAQTWLSGGSAPRVGDTLRNPVWAATLERLVAEGESAGPTREGQVEAVRAAWSRGFVAEAIGTFARVPHRHSSGHVLPGVITAQDCAAYEAHWEEPVTLEFHGHRIAKTGAWGQGPALLQVLQMLGQDTPATLDTADGVHAVVERFKLALADREAWYGDSGQHPPPVEDLLDPQYARARAELVGQSASHEVRPGSPGGRSARVASRALATDAGDDVADGSTGEPTVGRDGQTKGDTCHVDVVDRWGNMISATPSGGWLQSSPVVPDLGFALGSRLQMMWLEPGLPSSLVPGARPRTTLTPTLVLREDQPVLACGSPGGDQQDQWQAVFLLRHLVEGLSLQEAIDAPTFHTTSFPGSFVPRLVEPGVLVAEDRLGPDVLSELHRRGHRVQRAGDWALSRLCAVSREPETGALAAGANPRGMQGYAVGR